MPQLPFIWPRVLRVNSSFLPVSTDFHFGSSASHLQGVLGGKAWGNGISRPAQDGKLLTTELESWVVWRIYLFIYKLEGELIFFCSKQMESAQFVQ